MLLIKIFRNLEIKGVGLSKSQSAMERYLEKKYKD